jgi:PAS domain S-box-containing protein
VLNEEEHPPLVAPHDEPAQASLEYLVSVGPMIMFAGVLTGGDGPDLALDYVSPNCGRVLGHPPESLTGTTGSFLDRVHPEDRDDLLEAAMDATQRRTRPRQLEFRLRHLDGSYRWMESTIRDHDADRSRVLGYAVDVTARHRAETAQRQSESRLSAFLDNSAAIISLKDPFGRYQFVNRAFAGIVSGDAERIVGSDDFDHWPDAAVALRDHDRRVLVAQRAMQFEEVLPLPDGPHTFLAQKFPLLDDEGVPTAVGTVATDITELTEVLGTLAARERVLSSVIGASPDAITILEEDGVIRTTSVAFERIFGHPTRALVDRCLFDVVHPDDVRAVREGFARLAGDGDQRATLRFRAQRADREWVTIESHAQLMVDDEGCPDGVVMVSRDISDQIALEAALRDAKEHAERASNAKSEFLSRISHELRTPLNAMLGFAQLLEVEDLGDPGSEFVDQIIRAGDHLLSLINELLDIARIETHQLNLHLEALPAVDALREVADLAAPLARRGGVTLGRPAPIVDDHQVTVRADRQRLLQVLLNLTSNAIKYNHPGGRVDLHVESVGDGRARLSVTDTGQGLEADQLERLFVPFDRLGLEHTGIEGTGVGLALSRGLAERMGGALGVRSTPGVGSTFWVELPLAALAANAAPTTSHGAPR